MSSEDSNPTATGTTPSVSTTAFDGNFSGGETQGQKLMYVTGALLGSLTAVILVIALIHLSNSRRRSQRAWRQAHLMNEEDQVQVLVMNYDPGQDALTNQVEHSRRITALSSPSRPSRTSHISHGPQRMNSGGSA
eukprot:Clim_evm62s215 gene=Clim_evmTU62s215